MRKAPAQRGARSLAAGTMPVWLVTSFPDRVAPPSWLGGEFQSALARGDRIIAPSSYVAMAMIERYGIADDQITVIPRRVDTPAFNPAAVHPDRIAALRRRWGMLPHMTASCWCRAASRRGTGRWASPTPRGC